MNVPRSLRRAISLTEVLISMGILTLGLLGVAALFPVGGWYMQKAEVADRGSAIAQQVMSDMMARGMLNPGSWFVMVPPTAGIPVPVNRAFPSDGKYAPPPFNNANDARGRFARPFAYALNEALLQPELVPGHAQYDPALISKQFGSAFVIDPLGVAEMAFPGAPPQPERNGPAVVFPGAGYVDAGYYFNWSNSMWAPWRGLWPIRRVTFRQASTGWQMDENVAEHFFRVSDDLATEFPDRDDRPAAQLWDRYDLNNDGRFEPIARQWTGDYSWLVTVCPRTSDGRDAMASNPEGHQYDVSVVVFYKRPFPDAPLDVYTNTTDREQYQYAMSANERCVRATVLSTGLTGGELVLSKMGTKSPDPFENLRVGEWVMLCGPHPNSTLQEPRFELNWYQVLAIDAQGTGLSPPFDPATQRVVALRGPEWPWVQNGPTANNLCVGICPGAIAVHTKTVRLESPRTSPVTFGRAGDPTLDPPKTGLY